MHSKVTLKTETAKLDKGHSDSRTISKPPSPQLLIFSYKCKVKVFIKKTLKSNKHASESLFLPGVPVSSFNKSKVEVKHPKVFTVLYYFFFAPMFIERLVEWRITMVVTSRCAHQLIKRHHFCFINS